MRLRNILILLCCVLWLLSCGGSTSRLITIKPGGSEAKLGFEVHNNSDTTINSLYLAKTSDIAKAPRGFSEPNSPEEASTWGADLLDDAFLPGRKLMLPVPEPGQWDCRVVDVGGRYQHIAGLKLAAGGQYRLELNEGGWRRY